MARHCRVFPATHLFNSTKLRGKLLSVPKPRPKLMQPTKRPVSKVRMALTWLIFVGITVTWIAFLVWRRQNSPAPAETPPAFVTAIISLARNALISTVPTVPT